MASPAAPDSSSIQPTPPLQFPLPPQSPPSPREAASLAESPLRSLRTFFFGANSGSGSRPRSPLLGPSHAPSIFPVPPSTGLLAPSLSPAAPTPLRPTYGRRPRNPWTLRSWKVFTLDLYVRLLERPRDSRLRLKQTVAVLPFLAFKPFIDISPSPSWPSPVRFLLDVKFLGCMKLRVRPSGETKVQVRARAPLQDPRFVMDVVYERDIRSGVDGVKLTMRGLDAVFFKVPRVGAGDVRSGPGVGVKIPVHFTKGVKSTIRVKKYLLDNSKPPPQKRSAPGGSRQAPAKKGWLDFSHVPDAPRRRAGAAGETQKFSVEGPVGLDVKLRLWEFRNGTGFVQGEDIEDIVDHSGAAKRNW